MSVHKRTFQPQHILSESEPTLHCLSLYCLIQLCSVCWCIGAADGGGEKGKREILEGRNVHMACFAVKDLTLTVPFTVLRCMIFSSFLYKKFRLGCSLLTCLLRPLRLPASL